MTTAGTPVITTGIPPVTLQAAFFTGWPDSTRFQVLSYTSDVDPADLFNGLENHADPVPLDVPAADAALTAAGYERAGEWTWTDDIWGAVIKPAQQVP